MSQRILRLLTALCGILFLVLGVRMLFAPGSQNGQFGLLSSGPNGFSTIRGDMGGLFIGMCGFCLAGAIGASIRWLTPPAILLGLIVFGRTLSLILDGPSGAAAQSLTVEVLMAAILVLTIASLRRGKVKGSGFGFAVALPILLLLLLGCAFLFQPQIGRALAARTLERGLAAPLLPSLPDGLHAGLCGSGSPLPDPTRGGPCVFVIAGKHVYIVDTGDGSARKLALMGVPPGIVDGIFLTHFHSDHIAGLGDVLIQRWGGASHREPTPVYGPQGVETVVAGFNEAYSLDKGYRVAHHGPETMPPSGSGGIAHPFTVDQGSDESQVVLQQDGLTVTAFAVNHAPVFPAVGYRFDYRGRSIVISGDTAPSPVLGKYARGVDILFHEGLQTAMVSAMHDAMLRNNRKSAAKIMADIPSYHTRPEDAAAIAQRAGVRYLVFYHTIPPLPLAYLNGAFLGDARKIYKGPISVAKDGTFVSLTPGNTTVAVRELL